MRKTSAAFVSVDVEYTEVDGYHYFSSRDIFGLFILGKNLKEAHSLVAPAIQELLKRNHNTEFVVKPVDSFPEFLAKIENKSSKKKGLQIKTKKSSTSSISPIQRYVMMPEAAGA